MIYQTGTISSSVKLACLELKWEQKKAESFNAMKKQENLTPEERMIIEYKEDFAKMQENSKMQAISSKISSGRELTDEEITYLQRKNPQLLSQYREVVAEKEAYEKKLKSCRSKEDVEKLGIMTGDFVCFSPRTVITESGFIKSRFLDDKFSTGILLGYAKYLKEAGVVPDRTVYVLITSYEEVGHGGCAGIPDGVTEMISVDMGCVGDGLACDETMVSICAKDSVGPYDYKIVSDLVRAAKEKKLDFAVDVYPHYGSDVDAALKAGYDIRHGLIGPGVYASHGYERSHRKGAENTLKLLLAYLG